MQDKLRNWLRTVRPFRTFIMRNRDARKRWYQKPALLVPIFAVLLSAALAAVVWFACGWTDLGSGGVYGVFRLPGVQLLFHSDGKVFPVIGRVAPEDGDVFKISGTAVSGQSYAVLLCRKGVRIDYHGEPVSGYCNDGGLTTVSGFAADDGGIYLLLGDGEGPYGKRLVVLNFDGRDTKKTYDASYGKLNPWKVQVCDVDGDGKKEVSLGVYTVAKYHPVYAKRPFLYEFSGNKLYPKWLGSRLSRPFDDYVFCDADGDGMDELVASETTKDGKKELNVYKWTGFGFESIGISDEFGTVNGLEAGGGSVAAVCGGPGAEERRIFAYRNGKLITGG